MDKITNNVFKLIVLLTIAVVIKRYLNPSLFEKVITFITSLNLGAELTELVNHAINYTHGKEV